MPKKYVKVFQNRKSANHLFDRMADLWETAHLEREYFPQHQSQFKEGLGRKRRYWTFTITYWKPDPVRKKPIYKTEWIYAKSPADAKRKFKDIEAKVGGVRFSIKKVMLLEESGGMKKYTIIYTQKLLKP